MSDAANDIAEMLSRVVMLVSSNLRGSSGEPVSVLVVVRDDGSDSQYECGTAGDREGLIAMMEKMTEKARSPTHIEAGRLLNLTDETVEALPSDGERWVHPSLGEGVLRVNPKGYITVDLDNGTARAYRNPKLFVDDGWSRVHPSPTPPTSPATN